MNLLNSKSKHDLLRKVEVLTRGRTICNVRKMNLEVRENIRTQLGLTGHLLKAGL